MGAFDRIDKQFQNKPATIQLECYRCNKTTGVSKVPVSQLPIRERLNTPEVEIPLCSDCKTYCNSYLSGL